MCLNVSSTFGTSLDRVLHFSLGFLDVDTNRHEHGHDHERHLAELLRWFRGDFGIVSVYHTPKRGWQSDCCYLPIPCLRSLLKAHQDVYTIFSSDLI